MAEFMGRLRVPIGLILVTVAGFALATTIEAALDNHHLAHGFLRTLLFDLELAVRAGLPPATGAVLLLTIATRLIERRFRRGLLFLRATLSAGPALAFFLLRGYSTNRFRFAGLWTMTKQEILGIELPKALFLTEVWLANLWITLGAIALGLALWFALGRVLRGSLASTWRFAARPLVIGTALLLVVFPVLYAPTLRGHVDSPSFILVSLDTLRADHLGVYGYHRNTSPEMERLAGKSFVFDWAISQAPNTTLSHMSLFTSAYPTVHGFLGLGDQLGGSWLTLAEHLREAGYRTSALTDGGFMRGWYGYAQGFERFEDRPRGLAKSADLALEWLDDGLDRSPFFLFVHTYDIHSPYDPEPPFRDMFADPDYDGGFFPGSQELEAIRLRLGQDPALSHGLTPEDVEFIEARYDEGIRATDHVLGSFIERLEARGVLDKAWLIVTSDHGEEFAEHGSFLHEKLYHTVTHVPLLVRPPGGRPQSVRVPQVVELIDVMPTLLDLAKVVPHSELQGRSLVGLLEGRSQGWKNVAYSEHPWVGRARAMTTDEEHVVTHLDRGQAEIYRYRTDPLEQDPCPAESKAVVGERLVERLLYWSDEQLRVTQAKPGGTEKLELDEEQRQKLERELRALGYIR